MNRQNLLISSLKFVAKDLVGSVLYWPAWWYGQGLVLVFNYLVNSIKEQEHRLGLRIWLANLFKPMYGQYDWQGRLISFFMRAVVMVGRALIFLVWVVLMTILLIGWVVGPVVVSYQIGRYFI